MAPEILEMSDESASENKTRRRRGDKASGRAGGATSKREADRKVKMTLHLDAEAAKRLGVHAHLTGRSPGSWVSELILAGVPRYSIRKLDHFDAPDIGEDRQAESAA